MAVTKMKKPISALKALTLATLALPGISNQVSAGEAKYLDFDTLFSRYSESDNRIKVEVYQATANIPINDKFKLKVNGVKDIISGASPIMYKQRFNVATKKLESYRDMSSPSIREVRDSQELAGTYTYQGGTLGLGVARSSEHDYESNSFNIDSRNEFNSKRTVLATGYGFSSDQAWAIDRCDQSKGNPFDYIKTATHCLSPDQQSGMYKRPGIGGEKSTHQWLLGATQIINKDALVQTNLTYTRNDGYLSDPYKEVYAPGIGEYMAVYNEEPNAILGGNGFTARHDTRPNSRDSFAFLTRYVQHFGALNSAAMHVDYRFYGDNWGVNAHTFELAWVQPIYAGWQITPRARYYSQNEADFYTLKLTDDSARYYSSDYRLASFGAYGGGVQLSKEILDHATLGFGIDFYERKKSYGMTNGKGESFDDYSFSLFSANVKVKF